MKERLVKLFGLGEHKAQEVRQIPLASIRANPFQPRREFSDNELLELAASIETYGVLQPVLLRPAGQGYELIAGERRVRACRLLKLETIPALVRELSDQEVAVLALLENLQRQDLSFLEEAEGYARLLSEFGLTQEELARRLGKSQSTIANKLRLLRLPDSVRKYISREIFTERHARALLRLPDAASQERLAQQIVSEKLTVQATEELVAKAVSGGAAARKKPRLIRVYKDIRLFLNSVRRAVEELKRAGLEVSLSEAETDNGWEVRVAVARKGQAKARGKARAKKATAQAGAAGEIRERQALEAGQDSAS